MALNVAQWYQFALYGYLAHEFTSQHVRSAVLAWWLPYALFGVAYLARPFGGFLFGALADHVGRMPALISPALLMSICSFALVSLMGSGAADAALLVICRLGQGIAIGGEYPAAVVYFVERTPEPRRGAIASLAPASALVGIAIALVTAVLGRADTLASSRLPFLVSGCIGVGLAFVLAAGRTSTETPALQTATPYGFAFSARVLWGVLLYLASAVTFAMNFFFLPLLVQERGRFPALSANAFDIIEALLLVGISASLPFVANSTSPLKRALLYRRAALLAGLSAPFLYIAILHGTTWLAIASATLLALINTGTLAPAPELIGTMFPGRVRGKGVAMVYGVCQATVGGTAPIIARWLMKQTGSDTAPAIYVLCLSTISFLTTFRQDIVSAKM